jgi:hypothetical protein
MKKHLLLYAIAGLFLASCSSTIERNTTAFGGGWGISENKQMFVIPQNESVKGNSLVNEKSNALQSSSTKSIDQNVTKSTNLAITDNPESSNVELQIGKTQGPQNQFVSVINKSGSKNADQILKSIPLQFKNKAEKIKKSAALQMSNGGGNGFSIASLVLGILGLFRYGWLLGPLAIIFGIIGLNREGRGMALAGLILGILDIIIWLLIVLFIILTLL